MASIFLSYDREDEPHARPVAALLERSGHSVWWDRRIKGGREFAAEIEAALDAADRIVVLWSARAVKSAWVRDEAAVGRDTGRLVPATLDGTRPPLGFRQFQTIDLSKSKRRGGTEQLERLVDALDAGGDTDAPDKPKPQKEVWRLSRPFLLTVAAILALGAIVAIGMWQWRSGGSSEGPRIAIAPADSSPVSQQVARDLLINLPNLPGSDASAFQLVDASKASSADAVLTIRAASIGGNERRDLVLRAPDDSILWSTSMARPAAKSAELPQQLAVQTQRALACAAEALSYRRETIGQDTFRVYLSACTNYDNALAGQVENTQQIALLEQVVAKAPHFIPAWAKLLDLDLNDIDDGNNRHARLLATRAHLAQAQGLKLDFGELYAAKNVWVVPTDFVGIFRNYDEGLSRFPSNAALYRSRAQRSWRVGRMADAADLSSRAVELDPLSSVNQQRLIIAYAYAGDTANALAQLRKAERLFPGAYAITAARYGYELRLGDPKRALALLQNSVELGGLTTQQAAFLNARINPTPANIDRAITQDRIIFEQDPNFIAQITQTLAQFGRKDEVIDILLNYRGGAVAGLESEVLFRPAFREVWRDPRSMAAAAHFGLLYYWQTSGVWPDFCSDPTLPYNCKKEAAKDAVQKLMVAPAKK
jgi:tetratricopeptide (TPR) repeat protein